MDMYYDNQTHLTIETHKRYILCSYLIVLFKYHKYPSFKQSFKNDIRTV